MIRYVTLHIFSTAWEAHLAKTKLESEGIRAVIIDENTHYSIGPTLLHGVRLQVDREQFIKAKQILDKTLQN